MYKITEAFKEHIYTNKIDVQNITKDTSVNFKFITEIIKEWQNPNDSNYLNLYWSFCIFYFYIEDSIFKLQGELNEVIEVMKTNISELSKKRK